MINFITIKINLNFHFTDTKVKQAAIGTDSSFEDLSKRLSKFKYRACGIGAINNQGKKSKGVMCTEMNIVPNSQCIGDRGKLYTPPQNTLCLLWPNRDNNVCHGDFGGPG